MENNKFLTPDQLIDGIKKVAVALAAWAKYLTSKLTGKDTLARTPGTTKVGNNQTVVSIGSRSINISGNNVNVYLMRPSEMEVFGGGAQNSYPLLLDESTAGPQVLGFLQAKQLKGGTCASFGIGLACEQDGGCGVFHLWLGGFMAGGKTKPQYGACIAASDFEKITSIKPTKANAEKLGLTYEEAEKECWLTAEDLPETGLEKILTQFLGRLLG